MMRLPVDFNNLVDDGLVRASRRRLTSTPNVGERVIVESVGDEMAYLADVVEVLDRFVKVRVDWATNIFNRHPLFATVQYRTPARQGSSLVPQRATSATPPRPVFVGSETERLGGVPAASNRVEARVAG